MRFLLTRRWLTFAVVVVLLSYGAYLLGQWQFHRLAETKAANASIRTNLKATPVPLTSAVRVGGAVGPDQEWLRVTMSGRYQPSDNVLIRYQTRDGRSGVDIVTPLRLSSGSSVLVDRGWVGTSNIGLASTRVPDPPTGRVEVTGWLRADATGDATTVVDHSARAISSLAVARLIDGAVMPGFVDAQSETPAPAKRLVKAELPDLSNGPHFFYGLQWWFFGLLAVVGFFYLAYDERRKVRAGAAPSGPRLRRTPRAEEPAHSERSMPPSTGSITPETNEAAGESRKAAAAPNSSGRP